MSAPSTGFAEKARLPSLYTSAFDGYRRFSEEELVPWRASNDRVREIGGWQAYAREAQANQADGTAPDNSASDARPSRSNDAGDARHPQ